MKDVLLFISAQAFDFKVDLKFYIILVILAVSVVVICCLFSKNEKFKVKKEQEEKKEETYTQPEIIHIEEKNG